MISRHFALRAGAGILLLTLGFSLRAADPVPGTTPKAVAAPKKDKKAPAYLRIRRNDKGDPTSLETAVVRFVPASGEGTLTVDLVAAVHVGDASYYRQLNRQMEQYDALLYELVAPPGTRIPKGGKRDSDNPLAMVQKVMKFVLDLESQTEKIDYTKKNFIHADLSPKQMAEAMAERGDDALTITLGAAADMLRQQNLREQNVKKNSPKKEAAEPDLDLGALLEPDGAMKLKRVMAQQFEKTEEGLGPTLNTLLITDRNKACIKVLQTEMAKGKKKIGIFYGAAHMPDFEKRLKEEFGLKRQNEQWLEAWDMEKERDVMIDLLKLLK